MVKQKWLKWLTILFFVIGISLVSYSLFQIGKGKYNVEKRKTEAQELIDKSQQNSKETDEEEEVPIVPETIEFQKGETIGLLYVPKLDKELPIVEGTDEDDLELGVGHYMGTGYPMQNDQIVLSGHRDTVFRNFDQLEIGDTFIIKLPYGTFEYEIFDTEIVPADDTTVIGRYSEENLTVTTCYPFYFLGDAPDRFIFYARPLFDTDQ
ncbi:class D sortase [Fervidibacillus halotolerans]|uniref:Class D sortase n=1 Tax=Fervidibacillus halotolerans TaxID=2980027 RepID=A0A9E8LYG3_9BACI|nr:class D sortase [Fervidibacillus halotolerans]WAA12042.1 class D sortase [Fervidibacillus halotolerans]